MTVYIGLKSKTLINLLNNGFSSNNKNYWTIDTQYDSTQYTDYFNVTLNSTVNTSNTGTSPCYQLFDSISGSTADTRQLIYCQAKVRGKSTNVSWPRAYLREYKNGGSTATYTSNLSAIDGSTESELNDGNWHTMSGRFHTYNSNTGDYWSYDRATFSINVSNTEGDTMDIKDFIIVNLTEAFGRGNEPSKADCDNYMTVSDNDKIYYQGPEVESVAHNISKIYIGIDGVAHKIKKAYIGVNNIARLCHEELPYLDEVFSTITGYMSTGRNSSSTATVSIDLSSWSSFAVGDTFFSFFSVGGSLEICRLDVTNESLITRTQLSLTTASGETSQSTSISGTTLSSSNSLYGCILFVFKFSNAYSVNTLEYVFRNCYKEKLKYYYSSTAASTSTSSTNTRFAKASINGKGIIMPMFRASDGSNLQNCFSVSRCDSPFVVIKGAVGSSWLTDRVALVENTASNVNYVYPSVTGSAIASPRSYTLNKLYEDW